MPDRSRRRSGKHRVTGRRRGDEVAARLGRGVRESRQAGRMTQMQVAEASGVSQSWISKMERGEGRTASIETWCAVADSLGMRLAAFLEATPGAERPRDYEHLLRQQLVIRTSAAGSWSASAEQLIGDGASHWRYVDVLLQRRERAEIAVVEIWDWLDDVGEGLRGLANKVERVRLANSGSTVSGLLVVRATTRNRQLVQRLHALFTATLPGSSSAWLQALTDPKAPMPAAAGLLWTDVAGTRLFAMRRRSIKKQE